MTKQKFLYLSQIMKANYGRPGFLDDPQSAEVWFRLLSHLSDEEAERGVLKCIAELRYTPTVADILQRARPPIESDGLNEEQAWSLVRKALRNSIYAADEEFAKLPATVQQAVGSADELRQMSMMDSDTVQSVEKSHFVRTYRDLKSRAEADAQLPHYLQQDNVRRLQTAAELREKHAQDAKTAIEARAANQIEEHEDKATPDQVDQHMAEFYRTMLAKIKDA